MSVGMKLKMWGAFKYEEKHIRSFLYGGGDVPLGRDFFLGGGSAEKWPVYTGNGFEQLAEQDPFILVYPNAIDENWNDGRGVKRFYAHRHKIDDVGFLAFLIDHLSQAYPVDISRVYMTGASNGGLMAQYFAGAYPQKVAAIATVIAAISKNLDGKLHPSSPVSVMMINGTDDPLVPWGGGAIRFGRKENGTVISTDATVRFWVGQNKCRGTAEHEEFPDRDPKDGTRVIKDSYAGCDGGSEVVLFTVKGGGHAWPGTYDALTPLARRVMDKVVGRKSRDIEACEVIWDFLKAHSRQ